MIGFGVKLGFREDLCPGTVDGTEISVTLLGSYVKSRRAAPSLLGVAEPITPNHRFIDITPLLTL